MGCTPSDEDNEDLAVRDFYNDHTNNVIGKADKAVDRYGKERREITEDMFEATEESGGQEFAAVKPWLGALVAPTSPPPMKKGPPSAQLFIQFCNGYRTEDCRSNLYFLNEQTIVYPAACLGIVQDVASRKQKFYGGGPSKSNDKHKDDIISLALSPDKKLVATGSIGANPEIFVWDPNSRTTVSSFRLGRNTRAVAVLCFSSDGKTLFLGDKADEHNVYAYSVKGDLISSAKTGSDNLNDCAALEGSFGTVSKDGFLLFEFDGSSLQKKRGTGASTVPMTCVGAANGKYFAGGLDGSIFIFQRNVCSKTIKAHSKATMAISAFKDCLISSSSDGNLVVWSQTMEKQREIPLSAYCKAIDKLGDKILAGTRFGQILLIDSANQTKEIMKTHWSGQVWGLCHCPITNLVVTAGDDNTILSFDLSSYQVVSRGTISEIPGLRKKIGGASTLSLLPPNQQSRAVAISSKTGHVAFGTNTGGLTVRVSAKELAGQIFTDLTLAKEWIQVIRYCPKGEKLAVGSHDNNIYILNQSFERIAVCSKHNSFITNLDWSVDGTKIQSNCGAYEYLFFESASGKQLTNGATQLRDEKWSTYTVKLGWWVQGIFPPATSGDFVNSCVRSSKGDLIMTGDDNGEIRLFENPALKGTIGKGFKAHSSHVVRSHFTPDDKTVLSVGGFDKCLIVWKRA